MDGTIAPTDYDWYRFLRDRQPLDEVNFWKPSAERPFRREPFTPFLFKLKAPHRAICGFGWFVRYASLPDWMAWECFDVGNGCESFEHCTERGLDDIRLEHGEHEPHGQQRVAPEVSQEPPRSCEQLLLVAEERERSQIALVGLRGRDERLHPARWRWWPRVLRAG